MQKITAVLITRESQFPKEILQKIQECPEIDEVLVMENSDSVYNRFVLAQKAKNDLIYTQDDDCYVDNIPELIRTFNEDPTKIIHNCQQHHYDFYKEKCQNKIALIGWGSIFKKEWIRVLDFYLWEYPKDNLFLMTADRIFTYLMAPHQTIIREIRHHENNLKLGRMSTRPNDEHWVELDTILMRLECLKENQRS